MVPSDPQLENLRSAAASLTNSSFQLPSRLHSSYRGTMNLPWSQSEKVIARAAFGRASEAAEADYLRRHSSYRVNSLEDLVNLEQQIREWRKEWSFLLDYRYSQLDWVFPMLIRKGWLKIDDLNGLMEERLEYYRSVLADIL
jgi:hypothetical protein